MKKTVGRRPTPSRWIISRAKPFSPEIRETKIKINLKSLGLAAAMVFGRYRHRFGLGGSTDRNGNAVGSAGVSSGGSTGGAMRSGAMQR
jgi:hypothetical protein